MAVSLSQFYQELYLEHLEESAFLYESLEAWRNDPEGSWKDCADLETRMEAHIDALVIGEDAAEKVLLDNLDAAEPGGFYTITVVMCRRQKSSAITRIWETLIGTPEDLKAAESKPAEEEAEPDLILKAKAVSLALLHEYPAALRPGLTKLLNTRHGALLPLIALPACRWAELNTAAAKNLLNKSPAWFRPEAIRLIGNSGRQDLVSLLMPYLNSDDKVIRRESAIALLKLGSRDILPLFFNDLQTFALPLALSGDRESLQKLVAACAPETATPELIAALGVSGELSAVKPLVMAMYKEELAPAAADACQLILGAHLYGEVFIKEEFAEEDLFPEELESFKAGKSPQHPAGKEYGENQDLLNADPETWRAWLRENRNSFNQQYCYYLGYIHSLETLVRALLFDRIPAQLRRALADRAMIQYGLPLKDFSTIDPVAQQLRTLNSLPTG